MKDTIYRSDAIEAVHGACNYCETCDLKDIGCSQINALSALPSAENSNAKTQNSNQETQNSNGDLIYRADAIDAIQNAYCKPCKERGDDHNEVRCRVCEYDNAIIQIDALPSAELVLQTPQTYGKSINPSNAEVVSDYISRQDAIRWVKTECNPYGKPTLDFECGKKVIEHLEQMPSAEPKTDDENELKFYYVESLDDYWVGRRLDNFYYADWHKGLGFIWSKSKYLPWGEHIIDENTLWKEHTYPSEPIEIPFTEWIVGFVKKYYADRPTVVRSRSLMPTKDFREWAKRIKEVNPNAVVIPCDAEVASDEAVHGYTEWLEKIIVKEAIVGLCMDDTDKEWCEKNCRYSSIQAECLRHFYEVRKGGEDE